MGVRNLVGENFNKMVGLARRSMRPQRLVEMAARGGVARHPGHDAPVAPNEPQPLRGHFNKIGETPRIKHQRVRNRHAVAALASYLAAEESELQRMHALDAGGAGKDGQRVQHFGAIDS